MPKSLPNHCIFVTFERQEIDEKVEEKRAPVAYRFGSADRMVKVCMERLL